MNAQEWVKHAVILLPSRYDRKALREELTAHIEDHKALLMEAGCSPEEAEERAVAAMGDPKETAEQLREAMASWMNWVIVLLQLTALVLAVVVGIRLYNFLRTSSLFGPSIDSSIPEIFALSEFSGDINEGSCRETAESAGYTVSVYWAGKTQDGHVMVLLRLDGPAGTYGQNTAFRQLLKLRTPDGKEPYTYGEAFKRRGSTYVSVIVNQLWDPDMPWVELAFEHGEEPFCLRVVFEEAKP